MRAVLLTILCCCLGFGLLMLGQEWSSRRARQSQQQAQADAVAQGLDAFRQREGRLPCPADDAEGHENCTGSGPGLEGFVPWRSLNLRRPEAIGQTLRLRVEKVYTQARILDRLPVDALCRSGLYPDVPLAEEVAAQVGTARNGRFAALTTLRRWQLRPYAGTDAPGHLTLQLERTGEGLDLRWSSRCGEASFPQRRTTLPGRLPPARRGLEWSANPQGQRLAVWEASAARALFYQRSGMQWKAIEALPPEYVESTPLRQLSWSSDGHWLLSLSTEGEPRLWDCRALPCSRADFGLPEEQLNAAATTQSAFFGMNDSLILTTAAAPHLLVARKAERWEWMPTEAWHLPAPPSRVQVDLEAHLVAWENNHRVTLAGWADTPERITSAALPLPESGHHWTFSPGGHWLLVLKGKDAKGAAEFYTRQGAGWRIARTAPFAFPGNLLELRWDGADTALVLGSEGQAQLSALKD